MTEPHQYYALIDALWCTGHDTQEIATEMSEALERPVHESEVYNQLNRARNFRPHFRAEQG